MELQHQILLENDILSYYSSVIETFDSIDINIKSKYKMDWCKINGFGCGDYILTPLIKPSFQYTEIGLMIHDNKGEMNQSDYDKYIGQSSKMWYQFSKMFNKDKQKIIDELCDMILYLSSKHICDLYGDDRLESVITNSKKCIENKIRHGDFGILIETPSELSHYDDTPCISLNLDIYEDVSEISYTLNVIYLFDDKTFKFKKWYVKDSD